MQVKTTETRIRERAGREVAKVAKLRIRKRLITCMAGLLSISKSDSGFVEPTPTNSDTRRCYPSKNGELRHVPPGGRTKPRSYHRTGGESYYGRKKKFKYLEPFFLQIFYKVTFSAMCSAPKSAGELTALC